MFYVEDRYLEIQAQIQKIVKPGVGVEERKGCWDKNESLLKLQAFMYFTCICTLLNSFFFSLILLFFLIFYFFFFSKLKLVRSCCKRHNTNPFPFAPSRSTSGITHLIYGQTFSRSKSNRGF